MKLSELTWQIIFYFRSRKQQRSAIHISWRTVVLFADSHTFLLKLHYACRRRAIEVCIVEIHGLFSSDDDSREEQQRCASS